MLIRNLLLENQPNPQTICIVDGEIQPTPIPVLSSDVALIDGSDYVLLPGLTDAHIHGVAGCDFTDGSVDSVMRIVSKLGEIGVSYCVPSLASLELNKLKATLASIDAVVAMQQDKPMPGVSTIIGVHLEGPFIAENCKGAHDAKVLQPEITLAKFLDIISAAPNVTDWKMTLAPDIKGAIDFIRQTRKLTINDKKINVHIFIGHTNANEELIREAIEAGAVGFTHLGNANGETAQRCQHEVTNEDVKSNVVKLALDSKQLCAELIVDGKHLSQGFVKYAVSELRHNIILVSDLLAPALVQDDAVFMLGTLPVVRKGNAVVLRDDPEKLAGSATPIPQMIEILYGFLRDMDKSPANIINMIYHAAVLNPRKTAMANPQLLPDSTNFAILNKHTGKLVMHTCNAQLFIHDAELRAKLSKKAGKSKLFETVKVVAQVNPGQVRTAGCANK